jgi:DEAD/DEAH box helicase domain-containing protein
MRLACCLDDSATAREREDFEAVWNGFVRLYNLWQFLPYAFCMTQEGLQKHVYDSLHIKEQVPGEVKGDAWAEVRAVTDRAWHELLDRLACTGWTIPEAGYELTDDTGEIIASAEFAWPDLKLAFLQEHEQVYAAAFEKAGWRSYSLKEVLAASDMYLTALKKGDG